MSDEARKPDEGTPNAAPAKEPAAPTLASGAEGPTAVWDDGMLAAAGFDALEASAQPDAPATRPDVRGEEKATIEVSVTRSVPPSTLPKPRGEPGPGGLSWPVTIGLAVILGAATYFVVSLLR